MEPLTAPLLLKFFPSPWEQRCELSSELPAIIHRQHTPPRSLRPTPLLSLPQLPGDSSMEELGGSPGLGRFSELGHEWSSDAPSLFDGFVFA